MLQQRHFIEVSVLVTISALLYWLGFEIQDLLFKFTEFIPGVNWFYLPAGLRVLLVLVADVYGSVGITVATLIIDVLHMTDIQGMDLLFTPIVSGFGPLLAMRLALRQRNRLGHRQFNAYQLLQFALVYALLNASLHQFVWWLFQRKASFALTDVWPMFIGDLTGALAFLYGWKLSMRKRQIL
jgi:hypothetical protein